MKIVELGSVKVEKVTSLDDFKSRSINFRLLKPAVMVNGALWVGSTIKKQWKLFGFHQW